MQTISQRLESYVSGLIDAGVTLTEAHLTQLVARAKAWEKDAMADARADYEKQAETARDLLRTMQATTIIAQPNLGPAPQPMNSGIMVAPSVQTQDTVTSYQANDPVETSPGFPSGQS